MRLAARRVWCAVASAVVCLDASAALAEPRTHDGFQFRGVAGFAYWVDWQEPSDSVATGNQVQGPGANLEAFVGGAIAPGLFVGGTYGAVIVPEPTVSWNGGSPSSETNPHVWWQHSLGPYVDYYPSPRGGFHVLGDVGYALQMSERPPGDSMGTGTGYVLGAGVGYDWWVSNEWGVGVLGQLRFAHVNMGGERWNSTGDIVTSTFALSIQYH